MASADETMNRRKQGKFLFLLVSSLLWQAINFASSPSYKSIGPFYDIHFSPWDQIVVTEALGPFVSVGSPSPSYTPVTDIARQLTLAPFFTYTRHTQQNTETWDLFYPLVGWDRFGSESRLQIFRIFTISTGQLPLGTTNRTYTLFPFFYARRSPDPKKEYTALWPIAGTMKDRFFWDEVRFYAWPLYVKTRKHGVTTWNMPAPIFHIRKGPGLQGWQFWPLIGLEHQVRTNPPQTRLANKGFVLWPLINWANTGCGTTNETRQLLVFPFYARRCSPTHRFVSYGWPLGLGLTSETPSGYHQVDLFWPLIRFARGPHRRTDRIWPLFSFTVQTNRTSTHLFWPLWMDRTIKDPVFHRRISRVGLIFFVREREWRKDGSLRKARTSLWPLFYRERTPDGRTRFHALALLEPVTGGNETIRRVYAPFWSIWREETDLKNHRRLRSILWNFYRWEKWEDQTRWSLFFGLIQHKKDSQGSRWRLFFISFGGHHKTVVGHEAQN